MWLTACKGILARSLIANRDGVGGLWEHQAEERTDGWSEQVEHRLGQPHQMEGWHEHHLGT